MTNTIKRGRRYWLRNEYTALAPKERFLMEILAPCGSPEHIKAAVFSGADAVYLGGRHFSARRNAANFGPAELTDAIRFCREYGVRVYVTVNILTRDNEMPEMEKYLTELAQAAPDALIVQDMGVASLCQKTVPGLPLHASTQMSVHTPEGVNFCAQAGFERVVIARECTRARLEAIMVQAPIEIETFVHGALCVSLSGQCGLSAVIGRRSGNRGLCAQPCRLAMSFGCPPRGGEHLLSLKDLSLIDEIPVLRKMGVAALKIEGRMKRPEYVAAAVTVCRAALDGREADMEGLRAVFSRDGFTKGYFTGRHRDMNGTRTAGDGAKTAEALAKYADLIRAPQKRTPVTMAFTAEEGRAVTLRVALCAKADIAAGVIDGGKSGAADTRVEVFGGLPEKALTRETTADEIRARLNRLGGTPFEARAIDVSVEKGLFIPVSKINALRQEACAELIKRRVLANTPAYEAKPLGCLLGHLLGHSPGAFDGLRVHCETVEQLNAALEYGNTQAVMNYQKAAALSADARVIISPGRFILDEKKLLAELTALRKQGFSRLLCQNPAHILLGKQAGFARLHGGLGLNVFNSLAVERLEDMGLADVTASMELSLNESLALSGGIPVGLTVYGRLPLMVLRRCPFGGCPPGCYPSGCNPAGNSSQGRPPAGSLPTGAFALKPVCAGCPGVLTDRTKRNFPVVCRGGYQELLNADVLWMADKLKALDGFNFHAILLNEETPQETRRVIEAYTNVGEARGETLTAPPENFTRGLLHRGVE